MDMFEKDYTIHGIHATYIKYLVNEAKVFERYIDVYMTAAAMGCLYDKRSTENSSTDRARIYADAFSTERDKCMELFRTVILSDASKPWSSEERTIHLPAVRIQAPPGSSSALSPAGSRRASTVLQRSAQCRSTVPASFRLFLHRLLLQNVSCPPE